ncbi:MULTISPECIES: YeeE/YedE family protein [Jonquetella]|uniref:YeeE/YedE family protein n=1 Tax=Jonquetella TaxID=428711 RepID=UPI0003ADB00E|nr:MULTISPECIES: YeeE/YedE family protein [Jonquetella]ERL24101.1 sulfur transport [Jonquetella sp. BV3C21]
MLSGLLMGFGFGFLLKRSRICMAGGLRDVYLEKRLTGLWVMLLMIFVHSVIYFWLVERRLVPAPEFKDFPLVATVIGGLFFGFGAVMCNGCITMSLVKTGDGRLAGVMSLLSFMLFATSSKQGFLFPLVKQIQSVANVPNNFVTSLPFNPLYFSAVCLAVVVIFAIIDKKKEAVGFALPPSRTGLNHLFFERIWDRRFTAALIGVLAGFSFYFSFLTGRNGGWGITTPIVSWVNAFSFGTYKLSWASYFVLGIIIGSFVCAAGSCEFSFKGTDGPTLVRSFIGGAFMAFGAVLGQGCLVGHGITGTARLSVQAWVGLLSIVGGLWLGAWVYYARQLSAKK